MSQNSEPRNKKLGVGIYYTTIIISIVVMVAALILIKNDDAAIASYYRYMVAYYTIGGFLSLGIIIREFLVEICDTKKWIIKIIVLLVAMVIGTIIFIFVKNPAVGMSLMFVGFGILLYATVPTIPRDTNNKWGKTLWKT